jgi:hypothetical protein
MVCLTEALTCSKSDCDELEFETYNLDSSASQGQMFWQKRLSRSMGVWQGVAMDSLKFHSGLPCPPLLRPAGEPPLKRPYSHFRSGPAYPIGHPTPYTYELKKLIKTSPIIAFLNIPFKICGKHGISTKIFKNGQTS